MTSSIEGQQIRRSVADWYDIQYVVARIRKTPRVPFEMVSISQQWISEHVPVFTVIADGREVGELVLFIFVFNFKK